MHNKHNLCEKGAKMRFLVILSSLVRSTGLIMHNLIGENDSQVLMVIKMLERVINYAKLA